jgi:hypothetical protein
MKKTFLIVLILILANKSFGQESFFLYQDKWNSKQGSKIISESDKEEHGIFFLGTDLVFGWRASMYLNLGNEIKDYLMPWQKYGPIGGNQFSVLDFVASCGGILAGEAVKFCWNSFQDNKNDEKENLILETSNMLEELYFWSARIFEKIEKNNLSLIETETRGNRYSIFNDNSIKFVKMNFSGSGCFLIAIDSVYFKIVSKPRLAMSTNVNGDTLSLNTNQFWQGEQKINPQEINQDTFIQNSKLMGNFMALIVYIDSRLNKLIYTTKTTD